MSLRGESKANVLAIHSTNAVRPCHAELVSGTIRHCVLRVSLARFRNKFGMTLAESVPQCSPYDCTTKEVGVKTEKYLSLRAVADRVAIHSTNAARPCHAELVSASIRHGVLPVLLARFRNKLAMTLSVEPVPWLVLKSHVQPVEDGIQCTHHDSDTLIQ